MDVIFFVNEDSTERYSIEERRVIRQFLDDAMLELKRVPLKGEDFQIVLSSHAFFGTVTDNPYIRISARNDYDVFEENYCVNIDVKAVKLNLFKD